MFLGNSKPSGKAHPVSQVRYIVEYTIFSIESLPRTEGKKKIQIHAIKSHLGMQHITLWCLQHKHNLGSCYL